MPENGKLKLGFYWAASCGGCEIAVVELREKLLIVDQVADIVFWPCAMDFKYQDVEGYPDGYIDVCMFNGAIRTSENEHLAHLLRRKSKVLVAFGSCAYEGCIPGLANLFDRQSIFERVYLECPSVDNPNKIVPQQVYPMPEGEIELPKFYNTVKTLDQVDGCDYLLPGCPPQDPQIWAVIEAVVSGKLPPKGSVVGATEDGVRRVQARPRGEADQTVPPLPRDHRRFDAVPLRSGHRLCGAGNTRRLRLALHQGRISRAADATARRRTSTIRALRSSPPSRRWSTPTPRKRPAASSAKSPTRSARSTGSACPRRCCIGRRWGFGLGTRN